MLIFLDEGDVYMLIHNRCASAYKQEASRLSQVPARLKLPARFCDLEA